MVMLNRHKELTARLRSGKYLHVVREYNAAADSLAGEALEDKVSKVVLKEPDANQPESRHFVQIVNGNSSHPRQTFADFVQDEPDAISVMTRHQKKSMRKRVRFADHPPEKNARRQNTASRYSGGCPDSSNKSLNECDRRHDNSIEVNEVTQTNPDDSNEESRPPPATPNAEDIDPVTVQNERRRRIANVQEEALKWANLKAILRGNSAKLGYKVARDAWEVMDQFVLSDDGVLYYEGRSRRKRNDEQAEITLRLVVLWHSGSASSAIRLICSGEIE
ncbi:unnamed protein product [Phytophthora fragariaefolia]|uniref:Unnamed protein product n=1 Tax=Phytophthora fragariaefolia TaxID=1490495 RepID=A0A9W6WWJ8_9STRA|nr:unnamed protein product [Phytophthora fragariaefolia]